nr:hypothetical protein [Mammaliicoccus sp. Marseille-Q6498]
MVRQIYYLRREKYKNSRECVDELFEKKRCVLKPKRLTDFEKGITRLDDIFERKLAELFEVDRETLIKDDGIDWLELRRKFKHTP